MSKGDAVGCGGGADLDDVGVRMVISLLSESKVAVVAVVVRMKAGRRRRIWIAKHILELIAAGKV